VRATRGLIDEIVRADDRCGHHRLRRRPPDLPGTGYVNWDFDDPPASPARPSGPGRVRAAPPRRPSARQVLTDAVSATPTETRWVWRTAGLGPGPHDEVAQGNKCVNGHVNADEPNMPEVTR
jgi:hypothetical protein